jgi:ElaA protein
MVNERRALVYCAPANKTANQMPALEEPVMNWKCSDFEHLSTKELYSILRERSTVFIVEYAHIHLDIDDKDETALHVFLLESAYELGNTLGDTRPQIGAYARLLPGDELDPEVIIDKLLTSSTRRDDDTHERLVTHALAAAQTAWPGRPVHVSVPTQQENFYEVFGFRKTVGPFLEHGMPYLSMAWNPSDIEHDAAHTGSVLQFRRSSQEVTEAAAELPNPFGATL